MRDLGTAPHSVTPVTSRQHLLVDIKAGFCVCQDSGPPIHLFPLISSLLQKKVVEQLRKELLVKQEPETKLQLHVQTPPVGGDLKPANLLQSQQIPGGLQQVWDHTTAVFVLLL